MANPISNVLLGMFRLLPDDELIEILEESLAEYKKSGKTEDDKKKLGAMLIGGTIALLPRPEGKDKVDDAIGYMNNPHAMINEILNKESTDSTVTNNPKQ